LTAFILLICMVVSVSSQGTVKYPTRPIKAVIGFGAGGPTDVSGRGIRPILQEKIGAGIGITNMGGASSATAATSVLGQAKDGYTVFMGSEAMSVWQVMGIMDLGPKDFIPVKLVSTANIVLAVPPDSKFKTALELLAYAKEHPGDLRLSTAGPGTVPHLTGSLLDKILGCKFTFVPYQGGGPAVVAVMGGQVDATIEMVQGMVANMQGGKLKILGSFTNEPIKGLDIPVIGKLEPKLAPYLPYGPYFGLFAPKGTPAEIVQVLAARMDEAVKDPRWNKYCQDLYLPQIDYSGDAAVKYITEWTSKATWLLYETGAAKKSPAEFGIPKP
jgi:tripartite-type tricarboxylate transporter receptor subunit TctC